MPVVKWWTHKRILKCFSTLLFILFFFKWCESQRLSMTQNVTWMPYKICLFNLFHHDLCMLLKCQIILKWFLLGLIDSTFTSHTPSWCSEFFQLEKRQLPSSMRSQSPIKYRMFLETVVKNIFENVEYYLIFGDFPNAKVMRLRMGKVKTGYRSSGFHG